jgi:hypothetical protein
MSYGASAVTTPETQEARIGIPVSQPVDSRLVLLTSLCFASLDRAVTGSYQMMRALLVGIDDYPSPVLRLRYNACLIGPA